MWWLYILATMTICLLSIDADSSQEVYVRYREQNLANLQGGGQLLENSLSEEEEPRAVYFTRRRCERIRNVCASNNMIYDNYCEFKEVRRFEGIRKVECTTNHVPSTRGTLPPPVNRPVRPRPTTKPKTPKPLPEGEEGRINNKKKAAPQPDLTTKPAVELATPAVELTTKAAENCSEVCPLSFEPVCATDGKDYPNLCVFEASKCTGNTDKSAKVAYYGLCDDSPTTPPVGNLDITSSYRYCPEDVCEDTPNYVCGTDGKTYLNKCSLLKVACAGGNSSNLDIEYEGECRSLDITVSPEEEVNKTMEPLPTPKKSQMTTADPCANPTCEVVWEPVCADDGKTYPSRCVVDNINLCSGITLKVLYDGECVKSTTASKCPTCPPLQLNPVCGTDNNSYPSRCIIEKYNCESNMNIEVAYEGECMRGDI